MITTNEKLQIIQKIIIPAMKFEKGELRDKIIGAKNIDLGDKNNALRMIIKDPYFDHEQIIKPRSYSTARVLDPITDHAINEYYKETHKESSFPELEIGELAWTTLYLSEERKHFQLLRKVRIRTTLGYYQDQLYIMTWTAQNERFIPNLFGKNKLSHIKDDILLIPDDMISL